MRKNQKKPLGYWKKYYRARMDSMTEEEKEAARAARREKYKKTGNTDIARAQKRRASRKKKTGFTQIDVDAAMQIQKGLCAGCHADLSTVKFNADHCHATGMKRGLLCSHCNWALGHLKDDINVMSRLIEYLKSPPMSALNEE